VDKNGGAITWLAQLKIERKWPVQAACDMPGSVAAFEHRQSSTPHCQTSTAVSRA
jgi:hypothetical protein